MGTNYYATDARTGCVACGHGRTTTHIGKASMGWCFGLHVQHPDPLEFSSLQTRLNSWAEWLEYLQEPYVTIEDEYGARVPLEEMIQIVTQRWIPAAHRTTNKDDDWYARNHAEPGPHGLARHALSSGHCVGHAPDDGTWDLIVGDFS